MITVTNWLIGLNLLRDRKLHMCTLQGTSADYGGTPDEIQEVELNIRDQSTGKSIFIRFAGDDLERLKEVLNG